jgi:dihydrofolate reductase
VVIIAAMSGDRVIGAGDGMPWDVPEEYAQFLRQVDGQTLIMGRRSFEIFGRDLQRTELIVVSRTLPPSTNPPVARSLSQALNFARQSEHTIFIGGGASIYAQAIPMADRMHLSVIHGEYSGDAYFPEWEQRAWRVEKDEPHARYTYFEYVRILPMPA